MESYTVQYPQKNICNVYFHKKVQGTKNEDVFVDFVVDIVNLLFLKEYHMEKNVLLQLVHCKLWFAFRTQFEVVGIPFGQSKGFTCEIM